MSEKMMEYEIKGYIVAYDLPSENQYGFSDPSIMRYIRSKRIQCTQYLYKLGVNATNSVILVPKSKIDLVDKTIEKVKRIYSDLNNFLRNKGFNAIGEPLIKKIKIVEFQFIDFKELANKQLLKKLDSTIDRVVEIINRIDEGLDEKEKKSTLYNINRLNKEIRNLEQIAKELDLETNNKFELLSELIDQAINMLE